MKITKENNELVVRIPLKQKIGNPYMDEKDMCFDCEKNAIIK